MKYIYYIIAIMIAFSALAAYGIFDTRIEISRPKISVNDRIISEEEFEKMLVRKPPYMSRDQFVESIIEKQLLIQQAVKMKINREESFRQSVENFYEQSLIKILLDRKLDSLVVDVTEDEIEKYEVFMAKKLVIKKYIYQSLEDALKKVNGTSETIKADFIDLSDDLKFIVLNLNVGELSSTKATDFGYFTYRLEKILKADIKKNKPVFDMKKVSVYLQDKKKERLMETWSRSIRDAADIWRKK
ncbi:MAG: hypothetical protein L3J69_09660 [Desulfobacula sp.]|nr:hypothetical protein [Desulfobacula sp.]